jgi:hypothetical protein
MRARFVLVVAVLLGLLVAPIPTGAHPERPTEFRDGNGRVPTFRKTGPALLVCKGRATRESIARLPARMETRNMRLYRRCREDGYRHIQGAIDAVERKGSRILVLPGTYREGPTSGPPTGACAGKETGILSYDEHLACPHAQNLIAVLGDGPDGDRECDRPVCRLQIQGTARPRDVVIDNRFRKLNAIRADRADGFFLRGLTVQNSEFNSIYVLETDGFVLARFVARWNDEYGVLAFVADHGVIRNCNTYGNGDAGIYPGSAADHHGARVSVEVFGCRSHHNLIGYSGTAGNSTHVHDNRFYRNSTGITDDSFAGGHPGMPQDSATFRDNAIYANNQDYYRNWENGTCDDMEEARKRFSEGVVCPTFQVPIGTGILLAGGNANRVIGNHIYDNWRYGTMLFWVPATLRGEEDPSRLYDTSHFNRYLGNRMGFAPDGRVVPNGLDFWWDEEGTGNCWQGNVAPPGAAVTGDPSSLPDCTQQPVFSPGNPTKQAPLVPCATADPRDPDTWTGCDWYQQPPRPS